MSFLYEPSLRQELNEGRFSDAYANVGKQPGGSPVPLDELSKRLHIAFTSAMEYPALMEKTGGVESPSSMRLQIYSNMRLPVYKGRARFIVFARYPKTSATKYKTKIYLPESFAVYNEYSATPTVVSITKGCTIKDLLDTIGSMCNGRE
jgi:hypothetical protein